MKIAIVVLSLAFAVLVVAEDCPTNNVGAECTHVSCSNGFHLSCVDNTCTCNPNTAVTCTAQADCTDSTTGIDCNRQSGWHCVDSRCRCGGFFGGGGK